MGLGGSAPAAPAPTIITPPPVPPSPENDPNLIQAQANIFAQRYQREYVQPRLEALQEEEQARIPSEYGSAGFFPEEQQQFLQQATSQLSDLSVQPSLTAELAAQQSMFSAGIASMDALRDAASRRAQYQQAQYQAYAPSIPQFAMGFSNMFKSNQQDFMQPPTTAGAGSFNTEMPTSPYGSDTSGTYLG